MKQLQLSFITLSLLCILVLAGHHVEAADGSGLATGSSSNPDTPGSKAELRVEIEGLGILHCRDLSPVGIGTRILLQKPGGMDEVIATLDGLKATELYQANLDSDQKPEVVLIGLNPNSQEVLPFIFTTKDGIQRIHPTSLGDYPVFGKEISLIALASGPALCVKVPYRIHDFGPPYLIREECYRLGENGLVKTRDKTIPPEHFNQWANWARLAFQKGDYLQALNRYEKASNLKSETIPLDRMAEIRFYLAECRKFLKDFSAAIADYQTVVLSYPAGEYTDKAQRECEFLAAHQSDRRSLSLYIDALALNYQGKWQEALQLIHLHLSQTKNLTIHDHLLFQQGEAILALGKLDEAITIFKTILENYPESPLRPEVEDRLQELGGNPDETEGL